MQTDHQLIAACLEDPQGDDSWREFERRFRPRLVAGIRRGLACAWERPQPDLLEELLQNCYCRLLEKDRRVLRRCLDLETPQIGAYMLRTGRSVALDWLRHRGAEKRGHANTVAVDPEALCAFSGSEPTAERRLCAQEELQWFWRQCREIVQATGHPASLEILRRVWIQQKPSREVAAAAGLATSSVDSVICRTRRRLAERGCRVSRR